MKTPSEAENTSQHSIPIEGMTCASCVSRIERALLALPGVIKATVNLATERADVSTSPPTGREDLVKAIKDAGYTVPTASTVELSIEGMTCAYCVGRVEKALNGVPGVKSATVNLATEKATIILGESVGTPTLIKAVEGAGYTANYVDHAPDIHKRRENPWNPKRTNQMKSKILMTTILAITMNTLSIAGPSPDLKEDRPAREAKEEKPGKAKPYPLKTCIVSGDNLGEMGDPVLFIYKGQEIKLCCKPCKKDFDKNPAKYLKKLEGK